MADPKKLFLKLIGTMSIFDSDSMVRYFRGFYLTMAKDGICSYFFEKNISILEINAYLSEISDHIMSSLLPVFAKYGIELTSFQVNDINVPEDDMGIISIKSALAKQAEEYIATGNYPRKKSSESPEQDDICGISSYGGKIEIGDDAQSDSLLPLRKCPGCSADIPPDAAFCPSCGRKTSVLCRYCGARLSPDGRYCPSCGKPS